MISLSKEQYEELRELMEVCGAKVTVSMGVVTFSLFNLMLQNVYGTAFWVGQVNI